MAAAVVSYGTIRSETDGGGLGGCTICVSEAGQRKKSISMVIGVWGAKSG